MQTAAGSGSGRKEVRKMEKAMQKGQMGDLPLEELNQKEQELSQRLLRLEAMEKKSVRGKEAEGDRKGEKADPAPAFPFFME